MLGSIEATSVFKLQDRQLSVFGRKFRTGRALTIFKLQISNARTENKYWWVATQKSPPRFTIYFTRVIHASLNENEIGTNGAELFQCSSNPNIEILARQRIQMSIIY